MNKAHIRKLARLTFGKGKIESKSAKFVIENFTRKDLATFSRILKKLISETTVRVISADILSPMFMQRIKKEFSDKKVYFEQDKTITTGIKIISNDTIIDLSVANFLTSAIEKL